jgi:hypothetical protein
VLNILAGKDLFDYCQLRQFRLDFTGEKLTCITQEEKARQLAAQSAAEHARQQAAEVNHQTYGQYKRQSAQNFQGKRPRK